MDKLLLIGIGGGFGSIFRYLVSTGVYKLFGSQFPYGTFCVNAVGSFIIGFIFILLLDNVSGMADQLRALLIIGFLGGFTTFSSFSMETLNLIENGDVYRALLNIVLSVSVCLFLTWLGVLLGRQL